jgi:DNA repair exonuclease SbcCD nuclease subunit
MPFVHVFNQPRVGAVGLRGGNATIVSVPYPHKRAYDHSHPDLPPEARVEAISVDVGNAIREMLTEARDLTRSSDLGPVIFIGHMTVVGGKAGPERMMRMGWDVTVSAEAFEEADYVALGHLHPMQNIGPRIWYSGSPDYHDFGDDSTKGFLLVDVGQGDPKVEVVDSGARRMPVIEVHEAEAWDHVGFADVIERTDLRGATVLLRFVPTSSPRVPADLLAGMRRAAYEAGAFYVKDQTVPPESVRRSRVEIDPEVEVRKAVELWAVSAGVDPDRLSGVVDELLQSFHVE